MNGRRGFIFFIVVALGLGLYVYDRQNSISQPAEKTGVSEQPVVVAPPLTAEVAPQAVDSAKQVVSETAKTATPAVAPMTPAREKFIKLIADVKKQIPKRTALQKLSAEEAHFVPPSVQQAAMGMGQIAQAMANDPSLIPDGVQFYRECAKDDTSPNSIRASCIADHDLLAQKAGLKDEKNLNDDPAVSDHLKRLAKSLSTK